MHKNYTPFVIRVSEPDDGSYTITAEFRGATRTENIPITSLQLTQLEIEQGRNWLERGFLDTRFGQDMGGRLFAAIFTGAIRDHFISAYEGVKQRGGGVRVTLQLPPTLAPLPWELMYDAELGHGFLARSNTAPLARYFADTQISHNLPDESPLRILIVIASPRGYPSVSGEDEVARITASIVRRRASLWGSVKLVHHLR